jgi:prepilin-type N-terminal cleavage/methylation domain-containing protein
LSWLAASEGGLTLVEVLIAMVVTAIGTAALLAGFTWGIFP